MGTAPSSTSPSQQAAIDTSIEQQQLNNFLGPVKGAVGGLPVAEKNQEFYLVFDEAIGVNPEIINCTAFSIKTLVDGRGREIETNNTIAGLNNLIQNFETGKNAIVINDVASSVNQGLGGTHKIKGIGALEPILYNQTGSTVSASVDSIFFQDGVDQAVSDESILDFRGTMNKSDNTTLTTTYVDITAYNTILDPPPNSSVANFNDSTGEYTITSNNVGEIQNINFNITYQFTNNDAVKTVRVFISLYKGADPVKTNWFDLTPGQTTTLLSLNYNETDLTGSPVYKLVVKKGITTTHDVTLNFINFKINSQNPFPQTIEVPVSQIPFWQRGDSSSNFWITGSSFLSTNYGLTPSPIQKSLDFGFSPITSNFDLSVGDKIRFGYNPNNEYTIYEVIEPEDSNDGLLKFRLNTYIPTSAYLDNFVIYRINPNNPEVIILNVPNVNIQNNLSFTGVIVPEYISDRLQNQLNSRTIPADESRQ